MSCGESRFVRACRMLPTDATPVWFMRQAGRYMSEYRALRERYTLLELCRTPDLATRKVQATLVPSPGDFTSVAYSPDGKTLASGTYDGPIWLWDVVLGK